MTDSTTSAAPAGQPTETPKPMPPASGDAAAATSSTAGDPPKQDDPKPADPAKADPAKADEPLGEGGLKALQAEREARQELEKQLKTLSPLQKLAEMFGDGDPAKGKSEIEQLNERLSTHETELATERNARWRAEVANEKQLTAEQAAELQGKTRDELAAHADRLKTLFTPATDPNAPKTPKPDKSQGSRGQVDIDAQIAEAEKKGDVRTSIRLKQEKAAATRTAAQTQ